MDTGRNSSSLKCVKLFPSALERIKTPVIYLERTKLAYKTRERRFLSIGTSSRVQPPFRRSQTNSTRYPVREEFITKSRKICSVRSTPIAFNSVYPKPSRLTAQCYSTTTSYSSSLSLSTKFAAINSGSSFSHVPTLSPTMTETPSTSNTVDHCTSFDPSETPIGSPCMPSTSKASDISATTNISDTSHVLNTTISKTFATKNENEENNGSETIQVLSRPVVRDFRGGGGSQ